MNYGYPKIYPDFWISINQFLDIQNSVEYSISIIRFSDIQKSNYEYPKIQFLQNTEEYLSEYIEMFPIFGSLKIELWISKNRIMDILNSAWFLDIQS